MQLDTKDALAFSDEFLSKAHTNGGVGIIRAHCTGAGTTWFHVVEAEGDLTSVYATFCTFRDAQTYAVLRGWAIKTTDEIVIE